MSHPLVADKRRSKAYFQTTTLRRCAFDLHVCSMYAHVRDDCAPWARSLAAPRVAFVQSGYAPSCFDRMSTSGVGYRPLVAASCRRTPRYSGMVCRRRLPPTFCAPMSLGGGCNKRNSDLEWATSSTAPMAIKALGTGRPPGIVAPRCLSCRGAHRLAVRMKRKYMMHVALEGFV